MKNKKLLEKELQPLKEYQEKINIIIVSLGKLDLQINSLENTKKDLIKQIEEKGLKPLSMNATIQDMKTYLGALNVEATLKKVVK